MVPMPSASTTAARQSQHVSAISRRRAMNEGSSRQDREVGQRSGDCGQRAAATPIRFSLWQRPTQAEGTVSSVFWRAESMESHFTEESRKPEIAKARKFGM